MNKTPPALPKGWVWSKLKDISKVTTGSTPRKSKKEYYGNDYPFFKPIDLNKGYYIKEAKDGLSNKGIEKARLLPLKSILVTCIGATIGKTGFLRVEGASNQQINAIVPKKPILPEFIYFTCISPQFQKSIIDNASATTLPILNKSKFENLGIPLPPLPEQRRIVAKIEEVFSDLDAGVDALNKIKEQLKRYRQAVLKYTFEGKLTAEWRQRMLNDELKMLNGEHNNSELKEFPELPEGWVWTRLEEVTKIASGGTPSTRDKENFGGKIPWITPSDLSKFNGKYISKGSRNITEKGLNSSSAVLLPAGAVIFSSRAPIGYVAIAKNEFCTNQGCKNFIPKKGIFNEYLYYYLKGNKSLAESYASGTTFLELSASRAAFVPIPISPIQEQHKIVEEIEKRFSIADEVEKVVNESLKQAERLRQSILKKAFEGKLVPQDHNDEPAEKLLARIKAEKAKFDNERSSKKKWKRKTRQRRLL